MCSCVYSEHCRRGQVGENNQGLASPTCQVKKPLSRFTPLVRTKMSSGGLPAREVDKWESMDSSVMVLSDIRALEATP